MYYIKKISAANRSKVLTYKSETIIDKPNVFIKWNDKEYEGIIEFKSPSGDRYQVVMSQLEWEEIFNKLLERFAKDAHA